MDLGELGTFLKSRRDRIDPTDVGLGAGARRRVRGLRREEVALLAGASVDYYTQLEQGRGAQPSEQMLDALARTLRLGPDEREYLYNLAGRPLPAAAGPVATIQPAMLDLLDRLAGTPAQVMTDLGVTLVQNPLAVALLGRPHPGPGAMASDIYRWFTEPSFRRRYHPEEHEHQSRVFVADLRAAVGRRGPDPMAGELVSALRRDSPEFDALWRRHDVAVRRRDRKRLVHQALGVMELICHSLLSEDRTQRLLWFTAPPGTEAVDQLELLSVIGAPDAPAATGAERESPVR
ncbi:helix-turn-helix transcriptional regulator [Dactylosporangium sp. CA-092794]|uniref:helix-turn-helix transcriptional regulator n=1 Tax=Dactylosporangium sp. CA-092794 TaxID=3239929 RepID=UPI003D9173EB